MTLSQLINRPCVLVIREPSEETDDFGDPVFDSERIETVWEVQQRSTGETEEEVSGDVWLAFFLPDEPIGNIDAIEDAELGLFEVDGTPWPARNPRTQTQSHIEVRVRRTSAQVVESS